MITSFVTGFMRLFYYVISNRSIMIALLIFALFGIGLSVFPASIYFYPIWQSKVDYVDFDLFHEDLPDLSSNFAVPNRLVPDSDKTYEITIHITNNTDSNVDATLRIYKDKPYFEFVDVDRLPIASELSIPPGETIVRNYSFRIHNSFQPREPVQITFELEQSQKIV